MAEQEKEKESWWDWLWNGGMSKIGSMVSTAFDVLFWGAVMVGLYYLAKQFEGPIGDFLQKCGLDGAAGTDGFVHQAFVEGDKMIGEGIKGAKGMLADILPASMVNKMAKNMDDKQVAETLTESAVPKEIVGILAKNAGTPDSNWKKLVATVDNAGNKMGPKLLEGPGGAKVVADVLQKQPAMVKGIILALPKDAGESTDKKTAADLQTAIATIVKDPAQFTALLADEKVRGILVMAATKFAPVQFTDHGAALNTLLTKVAGDNQAIVGVQKLLVPMLDGAAMDTKTLAKAAASLLTDPTLAGVEGEVKALLKSLKSDDPNIQKQIDQINDPLTQAAIKAVGPEATAILADAKEKFDGAPTLQAKFTIVAGAVADITKTNPKAIDTLLALPQVSGLIDQAVAAMNNSSSPVKLTNTQPLKDYIASVAGDTKAMAAITMLVPALASDKVDSAALANLLTTQINNAKLPALLKSMQVADAEKNSTIGKALKFINTDDNFAKTKTLIIAINDKDANNAADIFAAIGNETKMNELMHKALQPENKPLLRALQTFAKEINANALPLEMQENLKSFADATPAVLEMLSQVPAEQLPKVMAAVSDLKTHGVDLQQLAKNDFDANGSPLPDNLVDDLLSDKISGALGYPQVRNDLAILLPLAKAPAVPTIPKILTDAQKTQNAAIDFLIKADAKGTHPNLDAVGNFFAAIEKNEGGKPEPDAQNKRVAKALVAKLTGKGDAKLDAADVAAFFDHGNAENKDNCTAFKALLDGLDVSALPEEFAAQKKMITALKEHFYVPAKDGKPAHGIAFVLADQEGAKMLVDALVPPPLPTNPEKLKEKQAHDSKVALAMAGAKSDYAWISGAARTVIAGMMPVLAGENLNDLFAMQGVVAPTATPAGAAPVAPIVARQ